MTELADKAYTILMREYKEWPYGQMGELGQGMRLGLSLGLRMFDQIAANATPEGMERDYKHWVEYVARPICEAKGKEGE